jgi:ketosteroid isomerase-like protein
MSNQPTPPPSASPTYTSLHTTALAFISAHALDPTHPSRMNFPLLQSLCAPDFQHSWGHNYSVSLSPRLQGTFSFEAFKTHLEMMMPALESWDAIVTDVMVDEVQRKVVLRVRFEMKVRGEKAVENDIVWMLEIDGEGKVCRSMEFVDADAAGKLKEMIMVVKK